METGMTERSVTRSVFLPPDLDEKLRVLAFRRKCLKSEIIAEALTNLFDEHNKQCKKGTFQL